MLLARQQSAKAGEWQATITYNGSKAWTSNANSYSGAWVANDPNSTKVIPFAMGYMQPGQLSLTTSGTVTIKFRWVRNDPNDKPPAQVMCQTNGVSSWTGSGGQTSNFTGHADNGLGSPEQPTYTGTKITGGLCSGVKSYVKKSPQDYDRDGPDPIEITNIPPISMSAIATGTSPMGVSFSAIGLCTLTGKVVNDHPHPVNFRKISAQAAPLHLYVTYYWDSSSGLIMPNQRPSDLINCLGHEYVTYSGGGSNYTDAQGHVFFQPTSPPFSSAWGPLLPQPTIFPDPAIAMTSGEATDDHHAPGDIDTSFIRPYGPASYTATQIYEFHCNVCMAAGDYEHLYGPVNIDEVVESVFGGTLFGPWQLRITQDGDSSVTYIGD